LAASKKKKKGLGAPASRGNGYRVVTAIGVGLGIASISVELAEVYDKEAIALGGIILGVGMTATLLPWESWFGDRK
jgi:hypothetical protein